MFSDWIASVQKVLPRGFFTWFSIICFLGCIAFSLFQVMNKNAPQMTMGQGLAQCAKNTQSNIQLVKCTRQAVSAQLQTHNAAYLMDEIATTSIPKQLGDCHGVAHIIGEETYDKYNSVERAVNECSQASYTCYGGCIHGVIAGAVKAQFGTSDAGVDIAHMDVGQIEKIGAKYCSTIGLCHGIGHILYYVTNDYEKAANACDAISVGFLHEMCVSGVFMQAVGDIHHSLVLNDSSEPKPVKFNGDYAFPCDTVSSKYQHQCFLYVPSYQEKYFEEENITDYPVRLSIAKKTCEAQDGATREYCFEGMGYAVFKYIPPEDGHNIRPALELCQNLPTLADQKSCALGYVNISRGYGLQRQSFRFCSMLTSSALQTFCYFSNFEDIFGPAATSTEEASCRYAYDKNQCAVNYSNYESQRTTLPDYRYGLYGQKK